MKRLWCVLLSPLLVVPAFGQAVSPDKSPGPSAQVAAMVDSLYKEVAARHPLGTPDRKVFGPYLSKGLRHGFDADDACLDRWRRANPDSDLKPDFGLLELGAFSGGAEEADPQAFEIEKVEPGKDGSNRARVKLTYREGSYTLTWRVVAVVILENGRPVIDDIIYLAQDDRGEARLSEILAQDCKDGSA